MHIPHYERPLTVFPDYLRYKNARLYTPPVLLVIGTIGNILSFIILTRRPMRNQSTYTYLAVLSLTDIFVLYVGLLRLWINELSGYDLTNEYTWSCRILTVLGYTASDFSVWLIIAVTVERWIAVCRPLKAPALCNQGKAMRIIAAVLIALVVINHHFLWTMGLSDTSVGSEIIRSCDSKPGYELLVTTVWPWVDAFLYSFLPVFIILTLNSCIIHQVFVSKRKRRLLSAAHCSRVQKRASRPHNDDGERTSSVERMKPRRGQQENSVKVTIMLLTVSFSFLVTTLPMNSMLIVKAFFRHETDLKFICHLKMIHVFTELLMYLNHSINFFLYCATGVKFRQQLIALFCPSRVRQSTVHRAQNWHSEHSQLLQKKTTTKKNSTGHCGQNETRNCPSEDAVNSNCAPNEATHCVQGDVSYLSPNDNKNGAQHEVGNCSPSITTEVSTDRTELE